MQLKQEKKRRKNIGIDKGSRKAPFVMGGDANMADYDYPDFIENTGYGTITGLCGANCYHL